MNFLRTFPLVLGMLVGALVPAFSVDAAPRNIVVYVADDLSPDLGCYGNRVIQTPHIDSLAKESTLYRYAYATTASCSASRSVILTGLHNHLNGQLGHLHNYHNFTAQPWVQSLPVLLGRQGYRTARVGKLHVGSDEVFAFDEAIPFTSYNPIRLAERSREFIHRDSDQPFFLYLATAAPHRSSTVATELPYQPNRFHNLPKGKENPDLPSPVEYSPDQVVVPSFLPDTPTCRAELAQYYQAVSRVDQGLGHLCQILKEAGHWDDTLILVTSDHGMAFAGAKTTVYEPGLRIPFLVRDPYQASTQGVVSDAMVSLLDITPTLVDYAGGLDSETNQPKANQVVGLTQEKHAPKKWQWVTPPEGVPLVPGAEPGAMKWVPYTFHGRSLLPTLGKTHSTGWDSITASHTFHEIQNYYPMRVYQDRQYKLIWNIAYQLPFPFSTDLWVSPTWQTEYEKGPETMYGFHTVAEVMQHAKFELFDMQKDPDEKINLANDPESQEILQRYIKKIKAFQREAGDPWIMKWDYE